MFSGLITMERLVFMCGLFLCCFLPISSLSASSNITCPHACHCSYNEDMELNVTCIGKHIQKVTATLPINTVHYTFLAARHDHIPIGYTNFSRVPHLKSLLVSVLLDHDAFRHHVTFELDNKALFRPLTELSVLRINANWHFDRELPELFEPLLKLQVLDLSFTRNINYRVLRETLVGFQNNTVLHTLILKNTQTLANQLNGPIFNLSYFLEPIQHCPLRELDLSYNALTSIYPGLLLYAPSLIKINIRNNMLYPNVMSGFMFEIMLHSNLQIADFSQQGHRIPAPKVQNVMTKDYSQDPVITSSDDHMAYTVELPSSCYCKDKASNCFENHTLASLYQSHNSDLCMDRLLKQKNICFLLNKACVHIFDKFREQHDKFCRLLIKIMPDIFAGIPCRYIPAIDKLLQKDCSGCLVFPSSGSLRQLFINQLTLYDQSITFHNFIHKQTCFHPNTLEFMDLSGNSPYGYNDIEWMIQIPLLGFTSLKVLNVSQSNLVFPYLDLVKTFPQISYIDLSYNALTLAENDGKHFVGSPTVTEINLSHNAIAAILNETFSDMTSLKRLNLSHNLLSEFEMNLQHVPSIELIDLGNNQIASVSYDMMLGLNQLAINKSSFMINLNMNPLLCTCDQRNFVEWLQNEKHHNIEFVDLDKYICTTENSKRLRIVEIDLGSMDVRCRSSAFYISIGAGCGALIMAICTGLGVWVYRRRWWFRYQCFIISKMYKQRQQQQDEVEYEFDAFVSYNCHDELWINEKLQPKLEDEFGLKLCLHERDFELGVNIMEQISASIENSRKTLLILSPNFLASTYCHWEMNLAHNKLLASGQDVLLLAILSPMSKVKMSRILKDLLEKKTYVEWTEDPVGQQLFWDKLHQAIRNRRVEYDLEEQPERTHLIQA